MELPFPPYDPSTRIPHKPIVPMREIVAYELLWRDNNMTFRNMAKLFARSSDKLPSDLVPAAAIDEAYPEAKAIVLNSGLEYPVNVLIHGSFDYPQRLRQAEEPVELLYYSGNVDLLSTRSVAVVGTRQPSEKSLQLTAALARVLVDGGFTVVSGLAAGIDTMAHVSAIEAGGMTIAVIGTPLDRCYPAENAALQKKIAREHLVVSQIPFMRYREQSPQDNSRFFPERNKTMSALTEATVIVQASKTFGTMIQAKAAFFQGRKVFLMDPCFDDDTITWPAEFVKRGAIRIHQAEDIFQYLGHEQPDQNR